MPPKYAIKPQDIVLNFLDKDDRMKNLLFVESQDTFWVWQNGWYKAMSDKELAKDFYQFCLLHHSEIRLTRNFILDLVSQLKWQMLNVVDKLPNEYICFKDNLFNTKTWEIEEHNRSKISTFYLPYRYKDLSDNHPNWDKFLSTSLVHKDSKKPDTELAKVVQEMFGNFLLSDMKVAASYFLVGGGANGKSVMLDILMEIIGEEFVSAMNIEALTTDKFSLPHLIGKRVNISNDDESKYIKSDKFKALITGDAVAAERKFGDKFTFKPNTKFVFSSNKIPTFSELNYGIIRRIKLIPFNQRFDAKNPLTDKNIFKKLKAEKEAIVKWALDGAKRLITNNYEHSPSIQSDAAMEEFQGDISSAVFFFRENYIVTRNSWISNEDLYNNYKQWCIDVGKKPLSLQNFMKDLLVVFTDLQNKSKLVEGTMTRGKTAMSRNFEDEFIGVENANTDGMDIEDIPM